MTNLQLENYNLVELNEEQYSDIDGGFFPIVVMGVMLLTSGETFALFLAGAGIGAAVAQGQK